MTAARVIAAVEPLLATQIKHARRNGLDVITIPIGRAINVMHDLQLIRDSEQRQHHMKMLGKEPKWLQ
jgi:hypothetical protein